MSSHTIVGLDIETARAAPSLEQTVADMQLADRIDARLKDEKKIEAAWQGKAEGAGLDASYGRVVAIGYEYGDYGQRVLTAEAIDERTLLNTWVSAINAQRTAAPGNPDRLRFVGHNIIQFDLPFLWRRMVVNSLRPPFWLPIPATLKPWSENVGDTSVMWAGATGRISLKKLAWTLAIEGKKEGMDGSQVQGLVDAGEWKKLGDYCLQDVTAALACYRRMTT